MKKSILIALCLIFCATSVWAGSVQDAVKRVIARKNVAAGGNMTLTVAALADDGNITQDDGAACGGSFNNDSETNGVSQGEYNTDENAWGFYRFQLSSAIPSTATITTATVIKLYALSSFSWTLSSESLRIRAEDTANAAQTADKDDAPGCGTGRALTTAYTDWTPDAWTADTQYTAPNIASSIQELVDDNTGLASGAYIQIWITDPSLNTDASLLRAYSYEMDTGKVAELYIEWE